MWKYIDVDGINTRYRESGEGSPIVLIHGGEIGGASADTWDDEFINELSPNHRVIAFDRLGSGYTDNPRADDEFRMSAVVSHAGALLEKLNVRDATVAGHSRGAFVASRLAKLHPELVARLVIINSASISVRLPVEVMPGTLTYKLYYETWNGDIEHDERAMSVKTGHITPQYLSALKAIAELPKVIEARQKFKDLWHDVFAEFEIIKNDTLKWFIGGGFAKPTLIVWGVGDPSTTARDAADLFEIFTPHVEELRMYMINRSGHGPHKEYPYEVGRAVANFVEATGRG